MGLLDYFRKHRLLAAFRQEPGISVEQCYRLPHLELPHLQQIAEACRRLKDREASSAQDNMAFPARTDSQQTPLHLILLPEMIDRPDTARELAHAAQEDIGTILDRLFTEAATHIVDPLLKIPGRTLPSGCCLNREALMSAAVEWFSHGTSPRSIEQALTKLIHDDPDCYITGYTDWAREYANTMLAEMQPRLALPSGCSLNRDALMPQVIEYLRPDTPAEQIDQALTKLIHEDPDCYITGYTDWAREYANTMLAEMQPRLALPSGCSLNRDALMPQVIKYLRPDTPAEQIEQALTKLIHDDPDCYITGYTDWAREYASTILAEMLPMLEKSAPRDCTPDQAWCQREIITLLKTQKEKSAVQQQFKSRVKIAPNIAYHGYYKATRACHDEAEQMWQRMKTTLVSANTGSATLPQSSQPSRPASGLTSQSEKPVANYLRTNSPGREIDIMKWLEEKKLEAHSHPLHILNASAARPDGKMFNERAILDEIASRLLAREDAAAIEREMLSLVITEEKYAIDFNPYEYLNMTDHHNHLHDYDTYKSNIPFNSGSSSSPI